MCGIVGIVNISGKSIETKRLYRMMTTIKHRGPDDEGVYLNENVGLGHVRLSIIDLSKAGHQPMQDSTKRYTLVYNGEIYNYVELKEELQKEGAAFSSNTDTEVLLQGYIKYGKDILNRLNGMFAFAVYDSEKEELFLARDRFGVKPLYYYYSNSEFIFASEIPAILEVYNKKNIPNEEAIFNYLAYNRTDYSDNTFFDGIKKLQHGHYMTISKGRYNITCWYNLSDHVKGKPIKSDEKVFLDILVDAVRLRLRSDVPIGVCLSGGLDSSTIVSIVADRLNQKDINTFSSVYDGKHIADESEYINLYKDKLKNMHYVHPCAGNLYAELESFIGLHAEPLPSTSPYAQYCTLRMASKYVKVTLDGQGADEELGGYPYFFGFYYKDLFRHFHFVSLFREIITYIKNYHSTYALKTFLFFLLPNKVRLQLKVKSQEYILDNFSKKFKNSVITDKLWASSSMKEALINHFEYKLEHLLKWNDRNSMAFSIESRTPFLDYRLVEYMLRVDNDAKIKNAYTKNILRKSMKGILPEKIRKRKDKRGFATPENVWFEEDIFKHLVDDIINSSSFNNRGIIDADKARSLYAKHCNGEINISKDIWKWINLEFWFRKFIDNKKY